MNNDQNLKSFRENGETWYEHYSTYNHHNQTLVIMPTVYPNVLQGDKSIYSRRHIFDKTVLVVQGFYNERSVNTIVTGPSGLGATGGEIFGHLLTWLIDNKDLLLKLAPFLFRIARSAFNKYKIYKSNKELAVLRSVRFKVRLSLSLYVDVSEPLNDTVPYMQQLILSAEELILKLEEKIQYADYYITYSVHDLRSDRELSVNLSNLNSKTLFATVIAKLGKVDASREKVDVNVAKRLLGFNIKVK